MIKRALKPVFDKLKSSLSAILQKNTPRPLFPEIAKSDAYDDFADMVAVEALIDSSFNDEFIGEIRKILLDAIRGSGSDMLGSAGIEIPAEFWNEKADEYLKKRFYDKGVLFDINDTLRKAIGSSIANAYREGSNLLDKETLIRKAIERVDEIALYEAERIARTESMLAATRGTMDTWRELGANKWELETYSGTCPLCLAIANGGRPSDYGAKPDTEEPEFHGNPYNDSEMNTLALKTGFSDWLPHPNCACVWMPYAEDAIEIERFERNAKKLQDELRQQSAA